MKRDNHIKPEFNEERGCSQSEVDEQDSQLRSLLREGLVDLAMSKDGALSFSITERGKEFNGESNGISKLFGGNDGY